LVEGVYGRDDDASDLVQVVRREALHVVQLGELPPVVRRAVRLELLERLTSQVRPVHEEQDAIRVRVTEQAIGGGNRDMSLPAARRHLDQGPRPVVRQGLLEVVDCPYLDRPETLL